MDIMPLPVNISISSLCFYYLKVSFPEIAYTPQLSLLQINQISKESKSMKII